MLDLAPLVGALTVALTGVVVFVRGTRAPGSWAFLALTSFSCVWLLLMQDDSTSLARWGFPVVKLLLPASVIHLALMFPIDRSRGRLLPIGALYVVVTLTAVALELFPELGLVSLAVHSGFPLAAVVLFLLKLAWDLGATTTPAVRQRVRLTLAGALLAVVPPGARLALGGDESDALAIAVLSIDAFPLAVGFAIAQRRVLSAELVLHRVIFYAVVTVLGVTSVLLAARNPFADPSMTRASPELLGLFVVMTILLVGGKEWLHRLIERVVFRRRHDPRDVLESLGHSLAASPKLDDVLPVVWRSVWQVLQVTSGHLFVLEPDHGGYVAAWPRAVEPIRLGSEHPLVRMARWRGASFTAFDPEIEDAPRVLRESVWESLEELGAEIVVPLIVRREPVDLIGLLVLGGKRSRAYFTPRDLSFLAALANQSALSISNALAYEQIETLNHQLERKVEERTEALAQTNAELQSSLQRLEVAYDDIQHSRETLTQAERLAALGRLTAGIAHEMNTPLGASLTSFGLIRELLNEYRDSIGDPQVTPKDLHEIVDEIARLHANTERWIQKAAGFIRSLKLHTRSGDGARRSFPVLDVVEDTRTLLSHRLRLSNCSLSVTCEATNPLLVGDPTKLGQVITNLVGNSIDAYGDVAAAEKPIRIAIRQVANQLEIRVSDRGSGIPLENRDRVFDEFFSTKPLGGGTGLGLAICRQIVTNEFGGTMTLDPPGDAGASFTIRCPIESKSSSDAPPLAASA